MGSSWLQRVFHHPGGCWHWRRDTSGVGDTLWGPATSPALLLPAGCLLSPPKKKKKQTWGTEYRACGVSRCFRVLWRCTGLSLSHDSLPQFPLPSSGLLPRRGGRCGRDAEVPRWTGRQRGAQVPPARGEGRVTTPLFIPKSKRGSCSQSGCWLAGLLAARRTWRLRAQLGKPRFIPGCLQPHGVGRDAQESSSSLEQGWAHPRAGGCWGWSLFREDISIACRGRRVTPQPCHHRVHQCG